MYRPMFDQAHAAEQGQFVHETDEERHNRFDGAAVEGFRILKEFGDKLGVVSTTDALTELMACLYVASFEMDRDAKNAGNPVMPFGTFEKAIQLAKARTSAAAWTDL